MTREWRLRDEFVLYATMTTRTTTSDSTGDTRISMVTYGETTGDFGESTLIAKRLRHGWRVVRVERLEA